jgi:hypothetical protein
MMETEDLITALALLAPIAVREHDGAGLREYIEVTTLRRGDFGGLLASEVGHRLRDFRNGFVYDRGARVILPCGYGAHSRTAAGLARLRTLTTPIPEPHEELNYLIRRGGQEADRFLSEGWGFVVNSPILSGVDLERPWPVEVGADVSLTAQEKIWFRGFKIERRD